MKNLLYILVMCGAMALCVLSGCKSEVFGSGRSTIELEMQSNVDSAYVALKQAYANKVIPLANHFFFLLDVNEITDTLIQYASPADLAKVNAHADYWMGEYLYQTNRQKEAMTLAEMTLKRAEEIADRELVLNLNSLLTASYQRMGMLDDALRCLKVCLDEDEKSGDKENMSSDLNNMAALFISLKQYDKAKEQIDCAIAIEETLHRPNVLAIRYGIASEVYMLLDILPEAEAFARKAYQIDSEGGREAKAAIRLSQLASVLFKVEQQKPAGKRSFVEVKDVLQQAIPILKKAGNTYSYIICENQLGDVFLAEGNFAAAGEHYLTALNLAEGNEYRYMKQRALNGLWKAQKTNDPRLAADYLEQYTLLADSLHTDATEKQLASLQAQFELRQLQAENERLILHYRFLTIAWVSGIIICLLLIATLCYALYARRKSEVIEKQNEVVLELIEEAKKETRAGDTSTNAEAEKPSQSNDAEFINQFVHYVNHCLDEGKTVDGADCASHLCVSPRHFSRKVSQITGSTPSAYINRIKINRSKRLLDTEPEMSITEISVRCGFEDLAYFGRVFKQFEGISPTQYRNK